MSKMCEARMHVGLTEVSRILAADFSSLCTVKCRDHSFVKTQY